MKLKIISEKIGYECDWIKIKDVKLKLPKIGIVNWQKIKVADGVAIVALDDKNNIYLVKEWRIAWGRDILEIPVGNCRLCRTEKERLRQARNELREEVGLDARKWEKLIISHISPRIKADMHIFLAKDLFKSEKEKEPGEFIKPVKMPFEKAYDDFMTGKILTTGYTILGMTIAKERLKL